MTGKVSFFYSSIALHSVYWHLNLPILKLGRIQDEICSYDGRSRTHSTNKSIFL